MVAVAGDLADVASPVPLEVQVVVLDSYLETAAAKAVVLAASGNHDLDGPGVHGEQVAAWLREAARRRPAHRRRQRRPRRHELHRVPLVGRPVTRDAVGAQLAAAAADRPARWVWLYHAPPAGTLLCRDGRREFPDHELAGWIAAAPAGLRAVRPHPPGAVGRRWLVARPPAVDTWVFNAGRQIGPVPPHITLDTEAGTADWFGVFENQSIRLG